MIKKILLVNPYSEKPDHFQPPLGLGYLAAALRKEGYEPLILDANKDRTDLKKLDKKIREIAPDAVGFQMYSTNFNYGKEGLKIAKKINKEILTLAGGPHVSALPNQIFKTMGSFLDFAFAGEAEIGLPKLLKKINDQNLNFSDIPGLIYKKNKMSKKPIVNPPLFFRNLDAFGPPAWDLIKPQTYPEAQQGAFFEKFPLAPILTTRGCPFNCSFCSGRLNTGTIIRKRSVQNIIDEILMLQKNYGIKEFQIIDDNFTFDKEFAKDFLKNVIKLKLDISFAVPNGVRLDTLDEELLGLMKKAGFYLLSVGIESGSDRILKKINKSLMTDKIREKVGLINKAGLDCAGFFIIGFPGETEKEIRQTINFSLELGLLRAFFFHFVPLPGTPIVRQLKLSGKLKKIDFDNFSFTKYIFSDKVSKFRLKQLHREAFTKFYLRPKVLVKNLLKIKRPQQILYFAKRAFHWLG